MATNLPFPKLLQRLQNLSQFRWFPIYYPDLHERQTIVFTEWTEEGDTKRIPNPLKWLDFKSGKKSSRDQFISANIYNEVPCLATGVRLSFYFTRVQGTDTARIYGSNLLMAPYNKEKGIIENQRRKVNFQTNTSHLYKVSHSLPLIKNLLQNVRDEIKTGRLY